MSNVVKKNIYSQKKMPFLRTKQLKHGHFTLLFKTKKPPILSAFTGISPIKSIISWIENKILNNNFVKKTLKFLHPLANQS